jgi:hypothetical protein
VEEVPPPQILMHTNNRSYTGYNEHFENGNPKQEQKSNRSFKSE